MDRDLPPDLALPDAGALALVAEADFVRGLARSLVRDEALADDIAQDALLEGMRRPPRQPGALRAWLAKVVRHRAISLQRRASAERRRQPHAARDADTPSVVEVLDREAARKEVVDAVLALPEPYRGAILLRYYEQLTPAQIAARLDVPGATVRSRLMRGLTQLRTRLDAAHHGERRAWAVPLAALGWPQPEAAAAAGTSVGTSWALAAGALTLCSLAAWAWQRAEHGLAEAATALVAPPDHSVVAETGPDHRPPTPPQSDAGTQHRVSAAQRGPAAAPAITTEVPWQLIDEAGDPVGGVPYWLSPDATLDTGTNAHVLQRAVTSLPTTSRRGALALEPEARTSGGILWLQATAGTWLGYRTAAGAPDHARFVLPARAALRVTCRRLPRAHRWQAVVQQSEQPADRAGKPSRRRRTRTEKPAPDLAAPPAVARLRLPTSRLGIVPHAVFATPVEAWGTQSKGLEFEVLPALGGWVTAWVEGAELIEATLWLDGLPEKEFRVRSTPTASTIRVLDPDRDVTDLDGTTQLTAPDGRTQRGLLRGGTSLAALQANGERCQVEVLMADGEAFAREVRWQREGTITFVRGRGEPPGRLRLAGAGGQLLGARVAVETADGALLPGTPYRAWRHRSAGAAATFCYALETDERLWLQHLPPGSARVWLLHPDGRIAHSVLRAGAELAVDWLPSSTRSVDSLLAQRLARAAGTHAEALVFELQLGGTDGTDRWLELDRVRLDHDPRDLARSWNKQVPDRLQTRFRCLAADGTSIPLQARR